MTDADNNLTGEQLADAAEAYVLGYLESDEVKSFEAQLAASQPAREAVAKAVELVAATRVALRDSADLSHMASRPARIFELRWSQALWGASGVVALVVISLLSLQLNRPVEPAPTAKSNDRLALIWSELMDESAEFEGALPAFFEDSLGAVSEDENLVADSPDWMLAAVDQLSRRDDVLHERDMENR